MDLIAEIGWSHLGDMQLARRMIHAASQSGANYVKFQTWKANRLRPGPWNMDGRKELYERAELSEDDHRLLKCACQENGVKFLTSCFCQEDLVFIRTLSNSVKIPSPECVDVDFVKQTADLFDNVFVSVGAVEWNEMEYLFAIPNVTIMHCVSSYPCEMSNFHWSKFIKIKSTAKRFGYSGHIPGVWDAIAAIANGASVVEKHFTIDNDLPGRDNKFALLPQDFRKLRDFADHMESMQTEYSIDNILLCEEEYRKFHLGRWRG